MRVRHLLFCCLFISLLFACSKENTNETTLNNGGNQPSGNDNSEQMVQNNDVIYPAGLEELTEKIKLAATGVPVDFDDDGFAEFQRTFFEDGDELVEMFTPDGAVYYQAEYNADGSHIVYQDINRDGMTDIQETLSIDPFGEERLYDRDFDGYPEERVRVEFDESNNSITVIYERDDVGLGDYIVTSEETIILDSDLTKRHTSKMASTSIYQGPVEILWNKCKIDDNESDAVAYERGLKISAAAACAMKQGWQCLKDINRGRFNTISGWYNQQKTIRVACAIDEKKERIGAVAWTPVDNHLFAKFLAWFNNLPSIFFSPIQLNGLLGCAASDKTCINQAEEDKLCNIFLHELFHVIEQVNPEGHDDFGDDAIYSCGRYCGGCAQNLLGATGDPHADCLRCAGTLEERLTCGYKEKIFENNCDGSLDGLGICHAGLACIAGPCEKCKTLLTQTCEYEILNEVPYTYEQRDFLCCAQCPADCDSANDFPCETSYLTENTCHDPLPMCTRER